MGLPLAHPRRRQGALALTVLALTGVTALSARPLHAAPRTVELRYASRAAVVRALHARPARLVRLVAPVHVAEVRPSGPAAAYVRAVRGLPGIVAARPTVRREAASIPASSPGSIVSTVAAPSVAAQDWEYKAAGVDRVPLAVRAAAARITIAVVDTGADVASPALAGKVRGTYNVHSGRSGVHDDDGHGSLVASLAGGIDRGGDGVPGFGGAARLLVVKVSDSTTFSDVDVAAGIVYAVRSGARIVNLSIAGREPSPVEEAALAFAARHGVLVIAAAGNDALVGDPPEYPAALLQPVGSNGLGGLGLSVAASDSSGSRAAFSEYGSFVSLAAPGAAVFGGSYGVASGTSFAAPEVAGAAALVWAADPKLTFRQVATILKETASGADSWSPQLGFGVIDAGAAVQRATALRFTS